MTTTPDAATSYDVRAALEERLERDPARAARRRAGGAAARRAAAERYLVGRLVPRTRPSDPPAQLATPPGQDGSEEAAPLAEEADPDLVDREITGAGEVAGDDLETGQATPTGTMAASALGLSFRVPEDVHRECDERATGIEPA